MDTSIKIGPIGNGLIKTVFTRDMKFNRKFFRSSGSVESHNADYVTEKQERSNVAFINLAWNEDRDGAG